MNNQRNLQQSNINVLDDNTDRYQANNNRPPETQQQYNPNYNMPMQYQTHSNPRTFNNQSTAIQNQRFNGVVPGPPRFINAHRGHSAPFLNQSRGNIPIRTMIPRYTAPPMQRGRGYTRPPNINYIRPPSNSIPIAPPGNRAPPIQKVANTQHTTNTQPNKAMIGAQFQNKNEYSVNIAELNNPKELYINRMQDPIEKVYIMFYRGGEIEIDSWRKRYINRFLSWTYGGYTHVELIFESKFKKQKSFEVYMTEVVSFKAKEYDGTRWGWLQIILTRKQLNDLYVFCLQQRDKTFNTWGMFFNFVPVIGYYFAKKNENKWFCSELTVSALQAANVTPLMDLNPSLTTPTELRQKLIDSGLVIISSIKGKNNFV